MGRITGSSTTRTSMSLGGLFCIVELAVMVLTTSKLGSATTSSSGITTLPGVTATHTAMLAMHMPKRHPGHRVNASPTHTTETLGTTSSTLLERRSSRPLLGVPLAMHATMG